MNMSRVRQYSLENVISGRHYDEEVGWVDTPIECREEALEGFKSFLRAHTREGSRNRNAVENMRMSNLPSSYGIFGRLWFNFNTGEAHYIAGQSYTDEIRVIRDLIRKHCG